METPGAAQMRLFTQGIWQTTVVAKALNSPPVFRSNTLAHYFFHVFLLGFRGVRFVVLPARSKLADIFGSGVYLFLDKVADVHGNVLILMVIVIVEEVFRNHVLLQALLSDLTF